MVDPVELGLVTSLNRPGGNLTGISYMLGELIPKRLGLLHELLPEASRFALLVDPNTPSTTSTTEPRSYAREIDAAFADLVRWPAEAVLLGTSPLFSNRHVQLVTLAARYRLPIVSHDRTFNARYHLIASRCSSVHQRRTALTLWRLSTVRRIRSQAAACLRSRD